MTRRGSNAIIEIECTCIGRTALALQVDNGSTKVWVPRSMIEDWSPNTDDEFAIESIFLPENIAIEKGLV